ncbi:MAG: hypothetical protein IJZ35_01610 [Clostridia bacterium]|nr:hypothetical protein [Clostridia bacterium]
MKKTIAILLACLMLLACMPVVSFAEETKITEDGTLSDAQVIASGDKWTISAVWTLNAPLTVQEGATLEVADRGYVTIATAGQIINNGTIIVKKDGAILSKGAGTGDNNASFINGEKGVVTLNPGSYFCIERGTYAYNKGTINNIDRMTINGTLNHFIQYPQNFSVTYTKTEMYNRMDTTVAFTVEHVNDADLDTDTGYTVASNYKAVPASGGWCEHGVKEYILITPEDGAGDWVDTGRMKLVVNGTVFDTTERIDNDRGVFTITPVGSMNIEILSTNYKEIVKLFEINLPQTEGYYVKSKDGEVGKVTVEYGKTFSFCVVLNEDYDKSDFYAYVNGVSLEPDEYGYFDITGEIKDYEMATTGGVKNDITITIMGVSSNESSENMSGIVNFIKQIFETIQSIFGYFTDLFTGIFSFGGTSTDDTAATV